MAVINPTANAQKFFRDQATCEIILNICKLLNIIAVKLFLTCALFVFLDLSIINAQNSPKPSFYNLNENRQPNLTSVDGHYLMQLVIDTPFIDIYVVTDIGSDLLWI